MEMRLFAIVVITVGLVACGKSDVTMGGNFPSMEQCISTIAANAGPLKMSKDTPRKISGTTSTGRLFACKRVKTGSGGIYYKGWYLVAG